MTSATRHGRAGSVFSAARLPALRGDWNQASVVEFDGTWEQYWSTRNSHFRGNVRRGERKVRATGEVTWIRYRPLGKEAGDADPRWDLFDECVDIAQNSWQGSSESGTTLSHEAIRDFLRDVHRAAAEPASWI